MPEAPPFALFVGAALALLLTPGPAVLYIVARSVDQGARAGIVSAMGLVTGGAVHVLAAVMGISALLAGTPGQLYRQGVVVSVLNPKAVLFFMAFLPQFVRPGGVDPRLQVLALGCTFLALAVCTDTLWALTAGRAGHHLRGPGRERVRRWVSAGVYFALALAAVWPRG